MTEITLLDGSIGQEIVKRAGDRATPLWSTSVMMEKPDIVGAVHADYFRAGATIATSNTYAVHRDRLRSHGLEGHFEELLEQALAQAEAARAAHGSGRIAGSLGPLAASYRLDLCPPPEEASILFTELVKLLDDHVDLYLIETGASVEQAMGALMGCASTQKPVWLSATVMDNDGTKLRSGEPLGTLAPVIEEFQPAAVLINCTRPEVVVEGLKVIQRFGKPFGAYANGFVRISHDFLRDLPTVDLSQTRIDLGPEAYANHALDWIAQGATIIGGCCEVGPEHIAELARRLRAEGHTIV